MVYWLLGVITLGYPYGWYVRIPSYEILVVFMEVMRMKIKDIVAVIYYAFMVIHNIVKLIIEIIDKRKNNRPTTK